MIESTRIVSGGKTLYGARVGILMLETRFPRIPGDMGNAETWPFPVLYKVVPGASPRRVVCEKAEGLLDEFLAAAERDILAAGDRLVASHDGIGAVLLECTNMVPYARALSQRLRLPVFSIYTFVTWFHSGLIPRDFGDP